MKIEKSDFIESSLDAQNNYTSLDAQITVSPIYNTQYNVCSSKERELKDEDKIIRHLKKMNPSNSNDIEASLLMNRV